jgi:chromosome segregation ATPase
MAVLLGTPVVTSPAMSDDGAFPTNPDVPVDPALLDALDKAERYKQKLHGAVKKGKSIEFEKNALREELERALTDLATANTKLRVMREMEAVSVEAAAAAAETPNAAVAELEGELEETRQKLEDTKSALEKSNASLNAAAQATATAKTERDALAKALDESSKALNNSKHSASKRGEADNIVAEARAEDAERRAGEIAAELAAQRVARAAAGVDAADARATATEARKELVIIGDKQRAERALAEAARRDADNERAAAATARDAAEASAADADARAARLEERAADAEAELERLSTDCETHRARLEHAQGAHTQREQTLRKELDEALRKRPQINSLDRVSGCGDASELLLSRAERAETSAAAARRAVEDLTSENSRLRASVSASRSSSNSGTLSSDDAKALSDANAQTARLKTSLESLEIENKNLQWRVAMIGKDELRTTSSDMEMGRDGWTKAGGGVSSTASLGQNSSLPLVERLLKNKTHRRAVVVAYLALLHLLVYFSTAHGTFSHGARVRCVSPV